MDMVSLLRTIGGLGTVLGILAGALWIVRRYDLRPPGRAVGARERRLELVETLPVDARRTIVLVRRDGREHLVLIAPEGHLVLETALVRDAVDQAADAARRTARAESAAARERPGPIRGRPSPAGTFGLMVERVRAGVGPGRRAIEALYEQAKGQAKGPPSKPSAFPSVARETDLA